MSRRLHALGKTLCSRQLTWSVADYRAALSTPAARTCRMISRTPGARRRTIPSCRDGAFHFAAVRCGQTIIAVQPERGEATTREPSITISRARRVTPMSRSISGSEAQGIDALVHMGAHGTLEWLPGKSVALSASCWPEALIGDLPVIYPFIVNDPGEAAQAKRRIGAVTIGHLPPPLAQSAVPAGLLRLERLLDEYSTADGLDPARRQRLIAAIRDEARAAGVEDDLGLAAIDCAAEAIPRIDRFVCDLKESQFGDGLHVFGRGTCGEAERDALLSALAGQRVAPGPSGSPYRGRQRRAADGAQSVCRRSARGADAVGACARRQARRGIAAPPSAGSRRLAEGPRGRSLGLGDDADRRRGVCDGAASRRPRAALGPRLRPRHRLSRSSRWRSSGGRAST